MRRHPWFSLFLLVLSSALACQAQKASNWRVYKLADRLPESACVSVTASPQGRVLVRHLTAPFVSELDGYGIRTIPSPDIGRSRVYQSPAGQLWAVVPQGLQEFSDGEWVFHRVPELSAAVQFGPARVIDPVPLWPVKQGGGPASSS